MIVWENNRSSNMKNFTKYVYKLYWQYAERFHVKAGGT
jgi:hypothetical protein